jgi:hypothetical protein
VFVTMMRYCVNDLAWDKMTNFKLLLDIDSTDADSEQQNQDCNFVKKPPVFTETKSPFID